MTRQTEKVMARARTPRVPRIEVEETNFEDISLGISQRKRRVKLQNIHMNSMTNKKLMSISDCKILLKTMSTGRESHADFPSSW
mmetsp:Transcript_51622/g.59033  ORF Transcript_51622/g.59033 Transcript_51622/m.59033 type:complete len:84 (+) Transcript_51622:298-549(+)